MISSHHNRDSQEIIKSSSYKSFYRYLNTWFSTIISLICSIKDSIWNLTFIEDDSVQCLWSFDRNPDSQKIQEFFKILTCLDNQADNSRLLQLRFFHPSLHRRLSVCDFEESDSFSKSFVLIHAADSWQSKFLKSAN